MELTAQQQAELDHAYGYHPPTPLQVALYGEINEAAKNFERVVLECCPSSADRSAAQRQIRDARMTANRSIALDRGATAQKQPTADPQIGSLLRDLDELLLELSRPGGNEGEFRSHLKLFGDRVRSAYPAPK